MGGLTAGVMRRIDKSSKVEPRATGAAIAGAPAADGVDGIMPTLRCANTECGTKLGQAHFFGAGGVFRIFACPKCGRGTQFENTPTGIAATPLSPR